MVNILNSYNRMNCHCAAQWAGYTLVCRRSACGREQANQPRCYQWTLFWKHFEWCTIIAYGRQLDEAQIVIRFLPTRQKRSNPFHFMLALTARVYTPICSHFGIVCVKHTQTETHTHTHTILNLTWNSMEINLAIQWLMSPFLVAFVLVYFFFCVP